MKLLNLIVVLSVAISVVGVDKRAQTVKYMVVSRREDRGKVQAEEKIHAG